MQADVVAMVLFFVLVAMRLYKRKKYIKFESGIILEFWKGGMDWLSSFVKRHRRTISFLENVSLFVGIVLSLVGVGFIGYSLIKMKQTLAIVLPSVGGVKYPGPVVSVPFWYWLIAIFIIAFPHETFHALFAKNENVKIRKYGILYFLLLPLGAFVEPDEKMLEKLDWKKKSKIFSGGSFINLLTSGVFLLLFILTANIVQNIISPIGLNFSTIPNTPASKVNLTGTLVKIGDHRIRTISDLVNVLNKTKPGERITIYTTKGAFNVTLAERNKRAFIGITNITSVYVFTKLGSGPVPVWFLEGISTLFQLLWWVFVLSLGVSIANMLPAKPLDGGLMVESYLKEKFGKRKGEKISKIISIIVWILLIFALTSGSLLKAIEGLRFS